MTGNIDNTKNKPQPAKIFSKFPNDIGWLIVEYCIGLPLRFWEIE